MDVRNLIRMANRIGDFFAPQPERDAALLGVALHLKNFWAPRMRRALLVELDAGGGNDLSAFVRAAIEAHRDKLQP